MADDKINNVIYLNKKACASSSYPPAVVVEGAGALVASVEPSFNEVMQINRKNGERMQRDRSKANQAVLRSYRLK